MFLPKKSKVLEGFVKQGAIIKEAASVFQQLSEDWKHLHSYCAKLEALENEADLIVQAITDDAEESFILPLDKEDVKELTELLDDIIDNVEETADRLKIYKMPKTNQAVQDFAALIFQCTEQIQLGLQLLNERKLTSDKFEVCVIRLHELEGQGDKLHRQVLEKMMGERSAEFDRKDLLSVIKWKEIFQTLEDTLDICETVAVLFVRLRIKYG